MSGRLRAGAVFLGTYAWQFLVANAQVVREVVTPGSGLRPAVLRVPLRSRTDAEVATFVALVGLTPGSFVLEVDDRRGAGQEEGVAIAVHVMHAAAPEEQRASLQDLERRLLAAVRGDS